MMGWSPEGEASEVSTALPVMNYLTDHKTIEVAWGQQAKPLRGLR